MKEAEKGMKRISNKISSLSGWMLALAVLAVLAIMFAAPLQAGAAVSETDALDLELEADATSSISGTVNVGTGSDRVMIVIVGLSHNGTPNSYPITASLGGQALTELQVSDSTQRRYTWMGYLKEAGIAARSNDTLTVTLSGTTNLEGTNVYVGTFSGVDQTSTIGGSCNLYVNNGTGPMACGTALSVSTGGWGIFGYTKNNNTADTDSGEGYTFSTLNVAGTGGGNYSATADQSRNGPTTNISVTFGGNTRAGMVGATLEAYVPPTTTVTDASASDPADSAPCQSATGVSIDAFDLNETTGNGSSTVSEIEVTFNDYTDVSQLIINCGTADSFTPSANTASYNITDATVSASGTVNCTMSVNIAASASGSVIANVTGITVTGTTGSITDTGTSQTIGDPDPSTITVLTGQTLYGDPYDVSGMFSTTGDVGSFEYKVTTGVAGASFDTGTETFSGLTIPGAGYNDTTNNVENYGTLWRGQPASDGAKRWCGWNAASPSTTTGSENPGTNGGAGGAGDNYVYLEYSASGQGPTNCARSATAATNYFETINVYNATDSYIYMTYDYHAYCTGTGVQVQYEDQSSPGTWNNVGAAIACGGADAWNSSPTLDFNAAGATSGNIRIRFAYTADAAYTNDFGLDNIRVWGTPRSSITTCTDWTSNANIPASGTACDPYTDGGTYTLDVRGTDPDCSDPVASGGAEDFTWYLCSDGDGPNDITITQPASSSTVGGTYQVRATIANEDAPGSGTATVTIAGTTGGTCDVTDASMTWGGAYFYYDWDTSACGNPAENPITIDAEYTEPDCSHTYNATQITDITVDNVPTTTVTDGTDPADSTPCTGATGVSIDAFDLNETTGNGSSTVSNVTLALTGNTNYSTVYVTCGGSSGSASSPGAAPTISLTPNVTVSASSTVNCSITADLTGGASGSVNASVTDMTVTGNKGTITDTGTSQTIGDPDPSTITVLTGQTASGDPYDVSGLFTTTGDVGSFEYKVTSGSGTGTSTYVFTDGTNGNKAYDSTNVNTTNPTTLNDTTVVNELNSSEYSSISANGGGSITLNGAFNEEEAVQMEMTISETASTIISMTVNFSGSVTSNNTPVNALLWNYITTTWEYFNPDIGNVSTTDADYTATFTSADFSPYVSSGVVKILIYYGTQGNQDITVDWLNLVVDYDNTLICTDWTSSSSIAASGGGAGACDPYTDGGTYTLDVRGTDPDCGDPVASGGAEDFTWDSCDDPDASTITINPPTSSSTVSGIYTITATVAGEVTAPNTYTSMSVTTSGSACDVTGAAMTDQGSGVWTYSWDTTACATTVAETGITINASGTDPDCSITRNAAQITDITVDNTCTETASVYLSQVGSTSGLIQQPIRGTVSVVATLLGTGGSNPRVSTDGSTWYAVPYSYSPPASSSGTVTFFVNATGNCGEITGAYDPSSVDYNTLANDYTITTCSECHHSPPTDGASRDNPSGAAVGSHYAHDRAGLACTDCHVNNAANDHREGLIEMSGYGANYTEGASFAQTNAPTLGTCTNLNCHGAATPTWGDNSRADGDCAICHGMSDSGKTGRDTAGEVATNDAQVGAHATHLNSSNNYSSDVACAQCHTEPSGADYVAKVVEGTGHNDTALPAELNWGPLAVTNGLSPNFITGTRVCNNTWCHGTQLGEGDQTPAWDNDALLSGSNADCQTCHDHPVYGGGSLIQAHQTAAYTSALSGDRCRECHPDMNNTDDYAFDSETNHVDGKIDAWTCITCHNVDQPDSGGANRRTVNGASGDIGTTPAQGLASHHIQPDASGVQDDTCLICHYQDMPKLTDGVNVRLLDPDSGSTIITYDGTGGSIEDFCWGCHDSGGATRLASPTQPFSSSGDTTAPADVSWSSAAVNGSAHRSLTDKCMGCHGNSGAAGGTLDPAINAHGSITNKITLYTYAEDNGNNFCFTCHDGDGPATDDISSEYSTSTTTHNGNDCLDCHNPHTASDATPIYGMDGVDPTNSTTPGVAPTGYTQVTVTDADDEYKVCFNCHSDWNSGPMSPLARNEAIAFNPENDSYHWIEGDKTAGTGSTPRASTTYGNFNTTYVYDMMPRYNGYTDAQLRQVSMRCSDCHGDDNATVDPDGVHGSDYGALLKVPNGSSYNSWTSTVNYNSNSTNIWCFNCHSNNFTNTGFSSGSNNYHTNKHDRDNCQQCHLRVVHGSGVGDTGSALTPSSAQRKRLLNPVRFFDTIDSEPTGNYNQTDGHNAVDDSVLGSCT